MTRRRGKGRQAEAQVPGADDEGPRFVLGSAEIVEAPVTLDERFKQLAEQREKVKAAGLAVRRAEATNRASQGRYDSLTAKRNGAPIAARGLSQAAVPARPETSRGDGNRGRPRAALAKKGVPVRRKDGAATVAAGFGLALPQRPGGKKGVKAAARLGRGEGRGARGAAVSGRGGGRASKAGRGGGGGRGRDPPPPSAEQLNSDLDAYFSEAKKE